MNFKGLQKVSTISERLQIAMDKRKIKQIDLARVADVNQGGTFAIFKRILRAKIRNNLQAGACAGCV